MSKNKKDKKMQTVVTFDGTTANKDECRYIKGDFYKIGDENILDSGQCFQMTNSAGESKFYRINSGYIAWDYEQGKYVLKSEHNLVHGLVGEGGELGYFTRNIFKNVEVVTELTISPRGRLRYREDKIPCINEEVAEANSNFFSKIDGHYYKLDGHDNSTIDLEERHHHTSWRQSTEKISYPEFDSSYNAKDSRMWDYMQEKFKESPIDITENSVHLSELLGGLSFGFESETIAGKLLTKDLYLNGIIPLRDGSIRGHEYTSIPLSGPKGVQAMINYFKAAKEICRVDQTTSLHFHIGNIFKGKSMEERKLIMIAIHMLYYYIQNEVWEILPPYKRSNDYFKSKRDFKDHCQPLRSLGFTYNRIVNNDLTINKEELDYHFNVLFTFLNDGEKPCEEYNIETRKHRKEGAAKWNIESRYYALNLYNAAFSNADTVEFRAYSGTVNPDKALSLLLISVGIIRFAMENYIEIIQHKTKYSLEDILEQFRTNFNTLKGDTEFNIFVADYLINFVNERKTKFLGAFMRNDIYSDEFIEDSTYSFTVNKKKLYG